MIVKKFYFTFGFGQKHENGFHVIKSKNMSNARDKMFEKFGQKWAFAYTEKQWFNSAGISQQEEYNLHEIK